MNEDHKDTKTKNAFNEKQEIEKKGSYKHRGFKKASEVKYQPGLQVNIPIGLRSSSEDPNEKKDDTATPDEKIKKGSLIRGGFKTAKQMLESARDNGKWVDYPPVDSVVFWEEELWVREMNRKVNEKRRKMKNTETDHSNEDDQ